MIRARAYIFKAEAGKIPTELIGTIDFDQSGSFLKVTIIQCENIDPIIVSA